MEFLSPQDCVFLEGQLPGWLEDGPGQTHMKGSAVVEGPSRVGTAFWEGLVETSKHAYWQFLPDKLISPFFLPELLDNLPSVKARQKGPLPCSDLAVPARQAHGLRQACRPSICIIGPPPSASTDPFSSPWGPWGSIRNTSLPLSGKV